MTSRLPSLAAAAVAVGCTVFAAWTNVRAAIEADPASAWWAGTGACLVAVALSLTASAFAAGFRSRNATLAVSGLFGAVLFGGLALEVCVGWVSNDARRNACARVLDLRREHSRAIERERLTADITEASDTLTKLSEQKSVGNASTAILAEFTGYDVAAVDRLVIVLRSIGVEFGGSILSMIAVALGAARQSRRMSPETAPTEAYDTPVRNTSDACSIEGASEPVKPKSDQSVERVSDVSHSSDEKLAVGDTPEERLLGMLRERGGKVFGSQRTIGLAVGVSGSHLNRVIRDLEVAGRVKVNASKRGTIIEILAA